MLYELNSKIFLFRPDGVPVSRKRSHGPFIIYRCTVHYACHGNCRSKIEKVPRGIRGEKSSKDMASSRNLVSTIGALASPKMGDGTRCPEG